MTTTIQYRNPNDLIAAGFNPAGRIKETRLKKLRASIEKHGFLENCPITITKAGIIADGHRRWTVAKLLNLPRVPVTYLDPKISIDTFWSLNAIGESPTSTEVLEANLNGLDDLPEKYKRNIQKLKEILGEARLKELFTAESFSPAVLNQAFQLANYCGRRKDGEFVRRAIEWLVFHRMQNAARISMKNIVKKSILVDAILKNRPLTLTVSVS